MSEVKVNLNAKDEITLLDRYGRRCSRETLVKRALTEVLRQQADDVPLYVTVEETTAKLNADAEAQRLAAEAAKPSPEVEAILFRFRSGERFADGEGREVSDLQPANAHEGNPENLPLMAQFDSDDAEWFPISLDELKPAIGPVPSHAADADSQGTPGIGDPEREFNA